MGFTGSTIKKRLSNLQVGSAIKLEVEYYFHVSNGREVEKLVMKDLVLYHSGSGEWYIMNKELLAAYISAFKETRLKEYGLR